MILKVNKIVRIIASVFTIVVMFNQSIIAQPDTLWTRAYGGTSDDHGASVQQTNDGGFIITGRTDSYGAGSSDVWLIKTDTNGDTVWSKTFGGSGEDFGNDVQLTNDGGYIVTASTFSFGSGGSEAWLLRTDSNGDTLWTKTIGGSGGDWIVSVQQTSDGGYITTGGTRNFGANGADLWIIRTDSNGNILWTKLFGGTGYDSGISIRPTIDNGYILTGETNSFGSGDFDIWLLKIDAIGDTLWTRTLGGSNWEYSKSLQQMDDGGYIIAGWTQSFGAGLTDAWLIRTDANGDTIWTHTYGSSNWDKGYSIQQTEDGGFVVAGVTWSFGAGSADVWLIRTDNQGDTIWTSTYGGTNSDGSVSVVYTSDGGLVLIGWTESFGAGGSDVWLIRLEGEIDSGLVAYYPFNGNANDESVYENHGIVNGATLTIDRFGNENSAYEFDGIDDYIDIPYSEYQQPPTISISCWVKKENIPDGFESILAANGGGDPSVDDPYVLGVTDSGYVSIGFEGLPQQIMLSSENPLSLNQWHHIVTLFDDEEDSARLYIDGILNDAGYEPMMTLDTNTLGLKVGTYQLGSGAPLLEYCFHGEIDDIMIFNRALTETEIDSLYHEGGWNTAPEPPTNLAADAAPAKVRLTWTASTSSDVSSYKIYRGTSANPTTEIASVSSTTTSYDDTGLTNGTTYYYRMTAVKSSGLASSYTSDVTVKPMPIWYVSTSGSSSGFGSSSSPLAAIQAGIDSASTGDTVLVHPGTYVENINYNGKNIVVGSLFLTTGDTSYISQTAIDGNQSGSVVTFESGEDSTTELSGFTITNGLQQFQNQGGGVKCYFSDPRLDNLFISNNEAYDGGGLYIINSNSLLTNLTFYNNTAMADGGGISFNSSILHLTNSKIIDNTAGNKGGGFGLSGGNLICSNTLVYNNTSSVGGAGIALSAHSEVTLINSNIVQNSTSNYGGGTYCQNGSVINLLNSIVYDNNPENIYFSTGGDVNLLNISNSLIGGGQNDIITNDYVNISWLSGNIDNNPLFSDTSTGDYTLSDYSPCIGAGADIVEIGGTWYVAPDTDIYGNPRPNPAGSNPDMGAHENDQPSQRPKAGTIADGLGADVDWYNSTTSSSANWAPFTDDSTVTYELAIGSDSTAISDILDWTSVGTDTFYTASGLSMTEGSTYYVSVRGTDMDSQVPDTTTTDGVTIDMTPPVITEVIEGSLTADIDFQNSDTTLIIAWSGSDTASGISEYEYALGTTAGDTSTVNWTDAGINTDVTITGLSLTEGVTYYASVRAFDMAGNLSDVTSGDGITPDISAPYLGTVIDGLEVDLTFTGTADSLTASWTGFGDSLSGIAFYEAAVGLAAGDSSVVDWLSVGLDTFMVATGLSLQDGVIYYVSVRATDDVGNRSDFASSDGVMVDVSAPVAGTVIDGLEYDLDWTSDSTTLSASWTGFSDAYSGIAYYEYAIGTTPGDSGVVDWTYNGDSTSVVNDSLSLISGTTYYVSVRATDAVGHVSLSASSDGIMVDTAKPLVFYVDEGGIGEDFDYQGTLVEMIVSWSGADSLRRDLMRYEYAVGTSAGDTSTVNWTDAGTNTDVTITGLSLTEGVTYYASVRAFDMAGNLSDVTSGDGITPDISAPYLGTVIDGLEVDLTFTGTADSLTASWTGFGDSLSGIAFYEAAVGLAAGDSSVVDWLSVGLDTFMVATGLSLQDGVIYYVSVRATDDVGNRSDFASSDGVMVDVSAPVAGTVIDVFEEDLICTSAGSDQVVNAGGGLNDVPNYYVNVRATDSIGKLGDKARFDGFDLDISDPVTITAINDQGSDIDWTSSTTTLAAVWSGFSDAYSGIEFYEYAIGTTSGGTNVIGWTDVDTATHVTNDGLDLDNGVTYFVSVRATDLVYNVSDVATTDGVTVDTIAPVISVVFEGATTQDEDYQGSDTTFMIGWDGSDDASGIDYYEYAVGSTPEGTDIVDWTNAGTATDVYITSLSLTEGTTYYGSVRAYDVAGNVSVVMSGDGITVDITPPDTGVVIDGIETDLVYTGSGDSLTATWTGYSDNLSGIDHYEYAVGSLPGESDIFTWITVSMDTTATASDLSLDDAVVYYQSVRATDLVGNVSEVISSNGITTDHTQPATGSVVDGLEEDESWTNSSNTLHLSWSGFSDTTSGIQFYEYAFGTSEGSDDVIPWNNVGLQTGVTDTGLTLINDTTYYGSVRATDMVGNCSNLVSSDGITVDLFEPTVGAPTEGSPADMDFQGSADTIAIFWPSSDEPQLASYEYCIGTTESDSDVVSWTNVGIDTSVVAYDLSLSHAATYFTSLRAYDLAGSQSLIVTSDGITVDIFPPAVGSVIDGTVSDEDFTSSFNTLVATWSEFEDTVSGIQLYEYAVGTSPGAIDVMDWSSTGLNTSVTDASFTLVDEQVYYVSVRATDNVDNVSDWISTDGITADHTGPEGYWTVDGDSVDIDQQNYIDHFEGYWSLFTDGISGLNRHEYALYDTTVAVYYLPWTDTGMDTSVVLTDLELSVDHVYQLYVRGVDNVENIGSMVKSDGVLVDQSAPAAPQNLIGFFSSERIKLVWDPSPEEDLAFYTVYAGTEQAPITEVLQTTTTEAESFVEGFQDGTTYYLRLTAVDIPGNESVFSDEVTGVPRQAVIMYTYPDTTATLSEIDNQIAVHFSQPLTSTGSISITSLAYPSMTVQSDYSETDTSVVVSISDPYASLDTLTLTISGVTDWAGDVTTDKVLTFTTYLLADYNSDFAVDVTDLTDFIYGWTNSDFGYELGPVSGNVPHLIPEQDGIYDLRDIMTFTRMWNWYHQTNPVQLLARESFGPGLEFQQSERDLLFDFPEGAVAGQVILQYPKSTGDMRFIAGESSEERVELSQKSLETGTILTECGYFSASDSRQIRFTAESTNRHDSQVLVTYMFLDIGGQVVSQGTIPVDVKAIPEVYALHQNYPNPFNPATTILYDLPEDAYVNVSIYDILGRTVRSLVSDRQEAGYHSARWFSKDDNGNIVGSGVYIYHLQAGSYSKTCKMILVK